MNPSFLEIVTLQNKISERYRRPMGYINAKSTWYGRRGASNLGCRSMMSGGTTDMREDVGEYGILIEGGIAIVVALKDVMVDGVRGGIDDSHVDKFEEFDATVDDIIRFSEL